MDLTTKTPAEVDTLLAPLEGALFEARSKRWQYLTAARHAAAQARTSWNRPAAQARYESNADEYNRKADEQQPAIEAAEAACEPYRAEYARRGGWTRIYWCNANGGHGHNSLSCRSLNFDTSMSWLPELSGKSEDELVELAGESACTWCFPSAPVDVLSRPSQLRPAVEAREAKAARDAEKATKAAAKAAKGITAPDGSPLRVDGWVVASEVTARNGYVAAAAEAADHAEGITSWGHRPDLAAKYAGEAAQYLAALAAKHGVSVEEEAVELAPKVAARRKKDARERAKYAR